MLGDDGHQVSDAAAAQVPELCGPSSIIPTGTSYNQPEPASFPAASFERPRRSATVEGPTQRTAELSVLQKAFISITSPFQCGLLHRRPFLNEGQVFCLERLAKTPVAAVPSLRQPSARGARRPHLSGPLQPALHQIIMRAVRDVILARSETLRSSRASPEINLKEFGFLNTAN